MSWSWPTLKSGKRVEKDVGEYKTVNAAKKDFEGIKTKVEQLRTMMVTDNASSTSTTNTPTLIPTLIPISARICCDVSSLRNLIEERHESIAAHKQKQTLEKDVNDLKDNREGNITELQCRGEGAAEATVTLRHWSLEQREMDIQMSEKVQVGTGNAARIGDVLASSRNSFEEPREGYSSKSMPKLNERSCLQSTRATAYNIKARTTGHDYMIPWRNTKEPAEDINDMHCLVKLSVLDVLQMFGRAGRPGMETSGVGYICTTEDKLTDYLDAVTAQDPI
ncbi:hypothetical protein M422DRAFT_247359 [Sphaerobolus stellatus SS14]|nr:hypothetical protein M422DRAFT_247359 [Sphaerobolus stellatus SS14]